LNKGEIEELVDPRLEGAYDVTQLKRFAFAASLCIRASSTWRPTMSEVPPYNTCFLYLDFGFASLPSFTRIHGLRNCPTTKKKTLIKRLLIKKNC